MAATKWLTFDAYGTLVDFDLPGAIVETLGDRAHALDLDEFLEVCARDRFEEVLGPYRPYREVLRASLKRSMERYGIEYYDSDGDFLIAAVPTFGPFPDVPPVLEQLRQHYKLVIISNTEDDLIAGNIEKLGVPIDHVITAEQARGYKPSLDVFRYTFDQIGAEPSEVVHIAQGFDYDIVPASQLGLRRIWINRRGIPGDQAYGPYDELPDLTGVPRVLGIE
ncbi:MAG: haloacid dehalogenase type II [Sphaerobacteraceae bacterium]|nr:MAG: haloacid dehalogenase type II [Sphaerobacteraceae bacterium]